VTFMGGLVAPEHGSETLFRIEPTARARIFRIHRGGGVGEIYDTFAAGAKFPSGSEYSTSANNGVSRVDPAWRIRVDAVESVQKNCDILRFGKITDLPILPLDSRSSSV
jgi:hypothetical protein